MKRDGYALSGPLLILGLTALLLAILWGLVAAGQTEFVVPPPEQEAESFMKGLMAHNFEPARSHLSQALQPSVPAADLQALTKHIEQQTGCIEDVSGQQSQVQGDSAQAEVQVKLKNVDQQTLSFPLVRENGLWREASTAPVSALLGP